MKLGERIIQTYKNLRWYNTSEEDSIYLLKLMFELTPYWFEKYIASYFRKVCNFQTKCIWGINDRWIDIIWLKENKEILIQCKKWNNNPIFKKEILNFNYDLEQIITSTEKEIIKCFATTSWVTEKSRKLAEQYNIKLIDKENLLKKMQSKYSFYDFEKDEKRYAYPGWKNPKPIFNKLKVECFI